MLIGLYTALATFVAGNVFRIIRIATMPAHLRWELFPIPAGRTGKLRYMAEEILFLRAVWENNRPLWIWSWLLHWALYLMICAAALTFVEAVLVHFGPQELPTVLGLVSLLSWLAAVSGVCGTAGLIAYRAAKPPLRMMTSRAAYLNLGVILGLFATGLNMLATQGRAAPHMAAVAGAVLMLGPAPALSTAENIHLCVLALFLAYFPFTHMTHMYLKYFAFHCVRWDDAPLEAAPAMDAGLSRALDLPVRWSAPHIRADGIKSWRAVAAEGNVDASEKNRS